MKLHPDTEIYMQLTLYSDGGPIYLMVPTYYDKQDDVWVGYVYLPVNREMITGMGKSSKDLEHNFNEHLKQSFTDNPEETFSLFHPLSYWEEMEEVKEDMPY